VFFPESGGFLDKNSTFKTSHSIRKYRFLFDQPKGLIYRYIIHSIPLPELDQLLLDSFRSISKQESKFQKSVVVVPAKAGHKVKRNNIKYFQFFSGHGLSPV
jgi:hypothetical protein